MSSRTGPQSRPDSNRSKVALVFILSPAVGSVDLAYVGPRRNRLEQNLIQIPVRNALDHVTHSQTMLAQECREFISVKDDFDDCLTVGKLLQDGRGPLHDDRYGMEDTPSPRDSAA